MSPWLAPRSVPRNRFVCLVLLLLTVSGGLGSRRFASELPAFVAENAGDCLWTVAAYLTICLVFPSWAPFRVLLISIAVSFLVEISQLIDWPILEMVRQTRLGRLLLGYGFLWVDLLRYAVGGLAAFIVDGLLDSDRARRRRGGE